MKRSDIRNAYDQMNPTRDQKERMLTAIMETQNKPKESVGRYQAKPAVPRRWSWIPAAAALIAVIATGIFILGLPVSDDPVLSHGETITSNEEIVDVYVEIPQLQAAREWYDYLYLCGDPDDGVPSDLPYSYDVYPYAVWGCRNQEMAAKLDEICTTYNLTFRDQDERMTDSYDFLMESVGLEGVLNEEAGHQMANCAYWDDGQFYIAGDVTLNSSSWTYPVSYVLNRTWPNVFLSNYLELASNETMEYWRYVHSSGSHMTIGIGEMYGFLYAPIGDDAFFVLVTNPRVGDIQSGEHTITRSAMEAFAETFSFSLKRTETEETVQIPASYEVLLNYCRAALTEGWTAEQCQAFNISPRFANTEYAAANAGYQITDLDGNGQPELIIGQGNNIWNLFVLIDENKSDGLLSDIGDGTFYRLYENGIVGSEFSGKYDGKYVYYTLDGTVLLEKTAVSYSEDTWRNELTGQNISLSEAQSLMDQYHKVQFQWTYFSDTPDYLRDGSEIMELYMLILEKYKTAIAEKWDPSQCAKEGISILIANYTEEPEKFGITVMDLDNNGTEELIITDGNVILDMYMLTNGEPQLVLHGWERNTYYLADGNNIYNEGSSGAANTVYNFYCHSDGGLILLYSVVFDAAENPEAPWFYQEGNAPMESITEEEAREIIDSLAILPIIPFTPITEIN